MLCAFNPFTLIAFVDTVFELAPVSQLQAQFLLLNEILFVFELKEQFTKQFRASAFDPFEALAHPATSEQVRGQLLQGLTLFYTTVEQAAEDPIWNQSKLFKLPLDGLSPELKILGMNLKIKISKTLKLPKQALYQEIMGLHYEAQLLEAHEAMVAFFEPFLEMKQSIL